MDSPFKYTVFCGIRVGMHSKRARTVDRAAVFAGWRDMNDYMRENKIEPLPPQIGVPTAVAKGQAAGDVADADGASAQAASAENAAARAGSRAKPVKPGGRNAKAHDS